MSEKESLNYSIILKKKGDLFFLRIPQLGLIVSDKDLSHAHDLLEEKKNDYFSQQEEIGEFDPVLLAPKSIENTGQQSGISTKKIITFSFAFHAVSILFNLVIVGVLFLAVSKPLSRMGKKFTTERMKNPERIERFRGKMEVIKPYINEINNVFSSEQK